MITKTYEYDAVMEPADRGGAYVPFPYDLRAELGMGRVKVHATFDGEPYDGSIVNMGVKNDDGQMRRQSRETEDADRCFQQPTAICYIIGVRKEIRAKIGKQPGDSIHVTIREMGAIEGDDT